MSGQQRLDAQTLAAQLQALRDQIAQLQTYIAQLTASLDSVRRARESIKAITSAEGIVVVPLDPNMNALMTFSPVDRDRVTIRLGSNIYARMKAEEASRILEERENSLNRAIEDVRRRLNEAIAAYERYLSILQGLMTRGETRGGSK